MALEGETRQLKNMLGQDLCRAYVERDLGARDGEASTRQHEYYNSREETDPEM